VVEVDVLDRGVILILILIVPVARRDPGRHAAPVVPVTGGSGHSGGSRRRRGSAGETGRRGVSAACAAENPTAGHALAVARKVEGRGGRVL